MRRLIATILYFAHVNAYQRLPSNPTPYAIEPYPIRTDLPYITYNQYQPQPRNPNGGQIVGMTQYGEPYYNYGPTNSRPRNNAQLLANPQGLNNGPPYFLRTNNNVRQGQHSSKSRVYQRAENFPFDLDYSLNGGSDLTFADLDSPLIDPRNVVETPSYYDDMELVENFGNYLKKRTQLDSSSTQINDAAHQYNSLMAVIVALARTIRNSCSEFDQIYDQIYISTVDTYYKYGLANADKVSALIEDYIRKGNSHMPKIRKLKQDLCDKELFCAASVDSHIKSSPLLYVKELETLEAITHLARSFYPYIEEFNQAAIRGTVLPYLQQSKDRLKDYILHVINSVEHLTDRQVRCA